MKWRNRERGIEHPRDKYRQRHRDREDIGERDRKNLRALRALRRVEEMTRIAQIQIRYVRVQGPNGVLVRLAGRCRPREVAVGAGQDQCKNSVRQPVLIAKLGIRSIDYYVPPTVCM